MRKWLIASLAAAALAGVGFTGLASAQPGNGPPGAWAEHHGPSPEMEKLMLDAHIAGMKATLKLTPEQEKLWTPFETAVRDVAKAREDARAETRERFEKGPRPTPIERLNEMADHLGKMSAQLKQVVEAAKPLYDSLNDAQKRDFGPLLHSLNEGGREHPGPQGPGEPHGEMPE